MKTKVLLNAEILPALQYLPLSWNLRFQVEWFIQEKYSVCCTVTRCLGRKWGL